MFIKRNSSKYSSIIIGTQRGLVFGGPFTLATNTVFSDLSNGLRAIRLLDHSVTNRKPSEPLNASVKNIISNDNSQYYLQL